MDFDMDDIPNPDELEWLERNALYPEDEEEDQYFYPEDLEPIQPPIPASENQINTKKRSLPVPDNDVTPSPAAEATPTSNEKRNRVSTPEAEIEEDWLRYSPPIIETIYSAPPDPVVEEERFISRFASEIDGNCIAVTGPDGNRVYAKLCQGEMTDDSSKKLKIKGYADSLISEPINVLMSKMEQEALTKALQASSESLHNLVHDESSVVSEKLWVDKYAPSSFTDLLSDEHTNREVLLWLKQWDSCVFGSEIRSTTDDVLSALKRHSSLPQHKKVSDTSFTSKNRRLPYSTLASTNYSSLGRESSIFEENHGFSNKKSRGAGPPDHKVLLLCGPPGLGKTTLAHVAAKHCGYRVVEINASDDRSSSTTETKILDVLQMNSIMSDGRPKCLVIDEIDGALGEGKGAVEVILKMVAADKKSDTGKGDGAQEGERGKASSRKRRKATLCRPVICICNDLYAPALRPLRQVAKVYVFVQPTINRVVNRLKYICYKEGFRTSSVSLTALAEYTECDIRSCLNTLQFLNKKNEQLNLLEIGSQIVGRKDVSRSAFDVWKEIFQKRKLKRERRSSIGCGTLSNDFDFLHSLVSNRGEYELTMDGIHENMLKLHYHDPLMQKTVECFDILGISDYLHNYIMRTQQMSLLAYQPSKAIAIRCLISQIEKPNIEWPKSFQRFRTLFAEKKDMLRSWQATITPFLSRHLSAASFVEDSLSLFLHILSPSTLTPVALHSHSDREKGVLTQLIDTMVTYSITYKNKRIETLPGTYRHDASAEAPLLSFDPPIDEFISFKDYRSEYVGLNLAMKQVLLHEVEKKKFLRESIGRGAAFDAGDKVADQPLPRPGNGKPQTTSDPYTVKDKLYSTESNGKTSTTLIASGAKRRAEGDAKVKAPGAAKKPSAGSFNFFDRFRKLGGKDSQNSLQNMLKQATLERDSRPLLFKFNEGFTNAVKRPVKVRDLLF